MKKTLIGLFLTFTILLTGCNLPSNNNQPGQNQTTQKTNQDKTDIIKNLFASKYELPADEIKINYSQETTNHARGTVTLGESEVGNTGLFLTTNINGQWEIVFDGNGVYTCQEVAPYNFPENMIEDCYDPEENEGSANNESDKIAILKTLFTQEPNFEGVTEEDITIEIDQETEHHLKGMVVIAPGGPGNAGGFMASDTLGSWELVWHGNGIYTCAQLDPYNFPAQMREGCYEE